MAGLTSGFTMATALVLGMTVLLLAGCALVAQFPIAKDVGERLEAFPVRDLPLEGDVTVYWSDRQVPFIEAQHDEDAAFVLGLVHAHLRLGQMTTARMLARGRVSEMVGPIGVDMDRGLRILSYPRAAEAIEQSMDEATHTWVRRFVEGINLYQARSGELPHEFRVLGLRSEPWTVADVIAIGRLAGTDVNWLAWAGLLPLRHRDDWSVLWDRMTEQGQESLPSFGGKGHLAAVHRWLGGLSRSGSNSLVLAPDRTDTGGALIASDPHLGIMVPNVWLLAGLKSPSYHVVGVMGPGLPVFALGRSPDIAWGGTNMRAASSDLYDVRSLAESEIEERRERIAVRWWPDRDVVIRETRWGPIVTDAPLFADSGLPPLALKWTGHSASDEIGAMLAASRARNFPEFRAAFDSFAVPGQNMVFADASGNIGQVMAVRVPTRKGLPPDVILDPDTHDASWNTLHSASSLPYILNPETGFVVSSNNRPSATGMPVGFFYSPDDRVARLSSLIEAGTPMGIDSLMSLQRDVYMASSVELRDLFVSKLDALGLVDAADVETGEVLRRLREWDGEYRTDSRGAVVLEQFRAGFVERFYPLLYGDAEGESLADVSRIAALLTSDIERADEDILREALAAGLKTSAGRLDDIRDWGDMHRLRLSHPLSNVPLIGRRYRFAEAGVGGSSQTVMKTAHDATASRHTVQYGSNARHVSDMTDPDENYFVLLGGQDGWFNSTTMLDQWPLWQEGRYVRIPLRLSQVRENFPHAVTLSPDPSRSR